MLYSAAHGCFVAFSPRCVAALAFAGSVLVAQPGDRERTETLSRRAAERLQTLHDEADRLAAEERTLLGDLRRLELDREIRTTELERAREQARAAAADLAALDHQVATLAAESKAALPDLQARLVTLYKLGRGQYARLLLSASDVRQFGQAVRLVSALAEQDRQRVAQSTAATGRPDSGTRGRQRTVRHGCSSCRRRRRRPRPRRSRRSQRTAALVHDIDTRRDVNAQFCQ